MGESAVDVIAVFFGCKSHEAIIVHVDPKRVNTR